MDYSPFPILNTVEYDKRWLISWAAKPPITSSFVCFAVYYPTLKFWCHRTTQFPLALDIFLLNCIWDTAALWNSAPSYDTSIEIFGDMNNIMFMTPLLISTIGLAPIDDVLRPVDPFINGVHYAVSYWTEKGGRPYQEDRHQELKGKGSDDSSIYGVFDGMQVFIQIIDLFDFLSPWFKLNSISSVLWNFLWLEDVVS